MDSARSPQNWVVLSMSANLRSIFTFLTGATLRSLSMPPKLGAENNLTKRNFSFSPKVVWEDSPRLGTPRTDQSWAFLNQPKHGQIILPEMSATLRRPPTNPSFDSSQCPQLWGQSIFGFSSEAFCKKYFTQSENIFAAMFRKHPSFSPISKRHFTEPQYRKRIPKITTWKFVTQM